MRLLKRIALGLLLVALVGCGIGGVWAWTVVDQIRAQVPADSLLLRPEMPRSTIVYTSDGIELGRLHAENRLPVGLDALSPWITRALLAVEDRAFYTHRGIDYRRFVASLYYTARGNTQGGSTLTMQLARNLYPDVGREQTWRRKVREMFTARQLERLYSKEELLAMYLNTMPFGFNTFGVESASQFYFSRPADALDPAQASLLVGVLQATTRYNPVRNPERALTRRNLVLRQMAEVGYLTDEEARYWQEQELGLAVSVPSRASSLAPHFLDYVTEVLEAWCAVRACDPRRDGLRVYTTLHSPTQIVAIEALEREADALQAVADYEWSVPSPRVMGSTPEPYVRLRDAGQVDAFSWLWTSDARFADPALTDSARFRMTRLEAGLVLIEPSTGAVRAWVGGRDFQNDQFDKVARSKRQPGSVFKPIVFAAALQAGFGPESLVPNDVRTYLTEDGQLWTPRNSNRNSGGMASMRRALAASLNTVPAVLTHHLTPLRVTDMAYRMGITTTLRPVLSLALGTSEVSLLEMTAVYATIAANGLHRTPAVIARIENERGEVLAEFLPAPEVEVLSETEAYTLQQLLQDAVQAGTGSALRRTYTGRAVFGGKTGTTTNSADGWFVALHPDLVVGAWVGFNDPRISFRTSQWGQGAQTALRLVGAVLQDCERASLCFSPENRFTAPPGFTPIPPRSGVWPMPEIPDSLLVEEPNETEAPMERPGVMAPVPSNPPYAPLVAPPSPPVRREPERVVPSPEPQRVLPPNPARPSAPPPDRRRPRPDT